MRKRDDKVLIWVLLLLALIVGAGYIAQKNESRPRDASLPAWRDWLKENGEWCYEHDCPWRGHSH